VKILVLHSRYLSENVSGENRIVEDEVELLRRHGHEVASWTPSFDTRRNRLGAAMDAAWSRPAVSSVRALLRRERPELVHVHNLFPMLSPAVLRTVYAERVPIVMTIQNFRLACLPATFLRNGRICEDCLGKVPWRGVVHACYRNSRAASAALALSLTLHRQIGSFGFVTTFATASHFLRDKLAEAGLDPGRMRTRWNFTWPTEPRSGPGNYFLLLGRLSAEKGVDTVTRTWEGSHRLLVVGDGPEGGRLRGAARSGVEFRPPVPPDEVADLLRNARALLLPSRWYEGWPRVAVEAFAAGVPVVASDIGGLPELVSDGEDGLLVAPHRPSDWVKAVRRLGDDAESLRLGAGARRSWAERFNPEVGLRTLEGVYAWTISRHEEDSGSC
jgi:glycosyltransferase involved in cell wall biosynthesis